jgi:hypothetical protein
MPAWPSREPCARSSVKTSWKEARSGRISRAQPR